MSLILCPECGTKISDRAVSCPHCGFQSSDPLHPISEQDHYEMVPQFEYDLADYSPNRGDLSFISYEDNKKLVAHFGDWATIQIELPAIANVIRSLVEKENVLVADIPDYVKKLIREGVYRFTIDKEGKILPTIREGSKYVKQVRLREMQLTPALTQSLNNLSLHAAMARILDEIERVGDSIRDLHIELQNDRIAMAEGAQDKLLQARRIQDAKLREIAMINVIHSATDAKRTLMRNFSQKMSFIESESGKPGYQLLLDRTSSKGIGIKAKDCADALVFITRTVQTEFEGYASLGEYESCAECLTEFKQFICDNKLNKRDTLLLLGENSGQDLSGLVNDFSSIARNIASFNPQQFLGRVELQQLMGGDGAAEDNENG